MSDAPRGLIAAHWSGDYPLAQAFWVNMVLIPCLFSLLVAWSFWHVLSVRDGSFLVPFILYAGLFAVSVWGIRGAWLSATRHVARGGQERGKSLAIAGVILYVLLLASTTVPVGFALLVASLAKGRV